MITEERIIKKIGFRKQTALQIAELSYLQWMGDVSFADDVAYYMIHGTVISRPDLFGMALIVDIAPEGQRPEPAWFVRMAVGELGELLEMLPVPLPKICFCRRNDGRMRMYSLERLKRKARRVIKWAAAA
jgi:hypothetical protein